MMKKIILIFLALSITGPASARLWSFADDCQESGGTLVQSGSINNISIIPYKNADGTNILSVLEVKLIENVHFLAKVFYIEKPELVDLAYKAYSTSQLVDVCYKPVIGYSHSYFILQGLRMRHN
ncbi:hypothetical protein ACRPOS_007005 [Bartonella heixiaziensis]|uniref:hypothetical protein n=1 Tax=Bartonella heixiaziensis TaxID=1461000 RepID=UPI0039088D42